MTPLTTGRSFKTVTIMAHVLKEVNEGKRVVVACRTEDEAKHLKKYFPGGYETRVAGEGGMSGLVASFMEGDPE